jgi:hypothetical protein
MNCRIPVLRKVGGIMAGGNDASVVPHTASLYSPCFGVE